jgi:phospholipid:diacylglycerol acyltransferase
MKIYCLYGVGMPTERSYYYAAVNDESNSYCLANDTIETCKYQPMNNLEQILNTPKTTKSRLSDMFIDTSRNDPIQRIETGVRFSDGDGSVPLISLGYLCTPSGPWTKRADLYNPGRSPIILKEYKHEVSASKLDMRGGKKASDHLDILGNWEMTVCVYIFLKKRGRAYCYSY